MILLIRSLHMYIYHLISSHIVSYPMVQCQFIRKGVTNGKGGEVCCRHHVASGETYCTYHKNRMKKTQPLQPTPKPKPTEEKKEHIPPPRPPPIPSPKPNIEQKRMKQLMEEKYAKPIPPSVPPLVPSTPSPQIRSPARSLPLPPIPPTPPRPSVPSPMPTKPKSKQEDACLHEIEDIQDVLDVIAMKNGLEHEGKSNEECKDAKDEKNEKDAEESYPTVDQPPVKLRLFQHQLTSIYELERMEREHCMDTPPNMKIKSICGIFGDLPGYGKTLSMLGMIARDKMVWDTSIPHPIEDHEMTTDFISVTRTHPGAKRIRTSLVVVPLSILYQWEKEIQNTSLSYLKIERTKDMDKLSEYKAHIQEQTDKREEKKWNHQKKEEAKKEFTKRLHEYEKKIGGGIEYREKKTMKQQVDEEMNQKYGYSYEKKNKKERRTCIHQKQGESPCGVYTKGLNQLCSFHNTVQNRKRFGAQSAVNQDIAFLESYDIVLCSATMYNTLNQFVPHIVWKRLVCDEADTIRIPSMRQTQAGFYWFMSATYAHLAGIRTNGLIRHCLAGIFDYIKYFLVRNEDEYVIQSFTMPPPQKITHVCRNPLVEQVLDEMAPESVIQMIRAGNIAGAIRSLGGEHTDDQNLVSLITKKKQGELQEAKDKETKYKGQEKSARKSERDQYLLWHSKCVSLESQLKSIEERFAHVLEQDCSICQSELNHPLMVPCCQNLFCGECILTWFKSHSTCPFCRQPVSLHTLIHVEKKGDNDKKKEEEKKEENKKEEQARTKPETILHLVQSHPKNQFLIFSSHDESYLLIRAIFEEHKQVCTELYGTSAMRDKQLCQFRNGTSRIMFLNSNMNGAGINLEMTTDIIFYHEMDPLLESQLIGRAQRIGRQSSLTIHYLP